MEPIPFNRPSFQGKELVYIAEAIAKGHISGNGAFTQKCQDFLERELGARKVFLTTSCTHALEMAALLLDLRPGDEVIVPSYTFVSTVNAFVLRGARPVFIDSRPDTLNMDERLLGELITDRTRAIVPVHYAGVGCEMDAITAIADEHGIPVVEDNAHGLFGEYKGRALGTFGRFAALSFHETKNFICGEGGALLINDPESIERAEIVIEKGTDRRRFFRGAVDKYTWVDIGSSYLPSEIIAAFLFAQLEAREHIQKRRREIWRSYYEGLRDWAGSCGARLPVVPDSCKQTHHMFYLLMPTLKQRQALIKHLADAGICAVFHYLPLNRSGMGRRLGGGTGACPVAEDTSDRLLRLPFYNEMSVQEQQRVIEAVRSFGVNPNLAVGCIGH